jgi:hypothetical protein
MGLGARICDALSFDAHRLTRLAQIAGASERLAQNLKRHAGLCDAPNIKAGLEALAIAEASDANALRNLLLPRHIWPTPLATLQRDGANNWARISEDLAAELEMVRALNGASAEWEGVDREIATRLRAVAAAKEATLGHLRDLALRCDPQALD